MWTLLKELLHLATEVTQSMATILLEKFDHGDFPAWLLQFECCASANKWADEDEVLKLPAFLRGVAATHFHALTDAQKDSYDHLIENLQAALCSAVCKEMFCADFIARLLHGKEDPAVYLHSLRGLLDKTYPTLSAAAKDALLSRQFLTGLPAAMRLKLLEHNPTPKLEEFLCPTKVGGISLPVKYSYFSVDQAVQTESQALEDEGLKKKHTLYQKIRSKQKTINFYTGLTNEKLFK